ncbi:hypothetical protein DP116_18865 [Brasilonema bromeliae SPC951]|uniref:Winged helix-turn helix domain-containing protein n=1 Tax=Brasilonema bromeliae SPC951 TaxID=385972 RepID=A0ABX1PBP6_9CYAN|nr:hypothetical protein [Brasilonema bromeliae SPC951]
MTYIDALQLFWLYYNYSSELDISRHRGWEYLKQMTFRLRVPRPEHRSSDPIEQENWKKNSI